MTAAVTSPLPAAEVEQARQQLRDDADYLTTVQTCTVEFDDGSTGTYTAPAPLTLVAQEAQESPDLGLQFSPRSKPPTGIDSLSLLAAIDNLTMRPHSVRALGGQVVEDAPDRAGWVWSWAQGMASAAPGAAVDAAKTVGAWRAITERLLDPQPVYQARGQACPSCGATKVWDRTDAAAGESYARPALAIDPRTGITECRCCTAQWAPELHEHLRQVLEQQQAETLAAGGWDPTVTARTFAEASDATLRRFAGLFLVDQGIDQQAAAQATAVLDDDVVADLARIAPGVKLAAVLDHAPRVDAGDRPVQCDERVLRIVDGEPERTAAGRLKTKRCPNLLHRDGQCPNAEQHHGGGGLA